jgi:hypothetical protein
VIAAGNLGKIAVLQSLIATEGGVVPITEFVECVPLLDDKTTIAYVIGRNGAVAPIAARVAELLERHGMVSVPDNAHGAGT